MLGRSSMVEYRTLTPMTAVRSRPPLPRRHSSSSGSQPAWVAGAGPWRHDRVYPTMAFNGAHPPARTLSTLSGGAGAESHKLAYLLVGCRNSPCQRFPRSEPLPSDSVSSRPTWFALHRAFGSDVARATEGSRSGLPGLERQCTSSDKGGRTGATDYLPFGRSGGHNPWGVHLFAYYIV